MLDRLVGGVGTGLRGYLARTQLRLRPDPVALAYVGPSPLAATDDCAAIDFDATPSPYVQPDRTTCGSACLVMARMINHPDYARTLLGGRGAVPAPDPRGRFHSDVLAMHELTNTAQDETGRWQVPWPKSLGTQPWAVVRRMNEPGGCGVSGSAYAVRFADPSRIDGHLDAIATAVSAGHCVPVFIGDALSPPHVALALTDDSRRLGFYDPSVGRLVQVNRDSIRDATMSLAGWHQLWLSILPIPTAGAHR